jgi:hypothetical protein
MISIGWGDWDFCRNCTAYLPANCVLYWADDSRPRCPNCERVIQQ